MKQIDQLAYDENEYSLGFTKKFFRKFIKNHNNFTDSYRYSRITIFREFSIYLCNLGISSYIPKKLPWPKSKYVAHVYSHSELSKIFEVIDGMRVKQQMPYANIFCFPILIRFLYCTGVRSIEALTLRDENVNINEKYIIINDSKSGKERVIPISETLAVELSTYLNYRDKLKNKNIDGYFFIKHNGEKLAKAAINTRFRKCLEIAGIARDDINNKKRLHDLRHTFAVHALIKMIESGLDLYVSLPILSQYLGHSSIKSTDTYVKLTTAIYPDVIKMLDILTFDLIPKNAIINEDN
ncbi:tyrosine-type recombinase/integrase [Flavobacterium sp. DG1-102-2]|uniref:tyrosine-type recombinase/integrase n=1 Tax=Flavobacterium sp. DG1-102-2 TaxID=3081663 RepID=UPI00294A80A6|nr:tyrosine-type recombinase/integrase [Flavobacterium sp. DG1-102-2]MDV6167119.1 tyrosine-type recombinase/integrase [Flavobacterium sp. DG1-102-2]